ncbi:hypothetical protein AAUPMB_12571, partial [Pasteurella multocida subsp. multocida str. Anand1_buffalo]
GLSKSNQDYAEQLLGGLDHLPIMDQDQVKNHAT